MSEDFYNDNDELLIEDEEFNNSEEINLDNSELVAESLPPEMEIVGVRFENNCKLYYFNPNGNKFEIGTKVVVDTSRGIELGTIVVSNKFVKTEELFLPLKDIVRIATKDDIDRYEANKHMEKEAAVLFCEQVEKHNLEMKLIDVIYTLDNSKLTFFFTSSGRVDFRELVKDLAGLFRTRIELRQIGIRDETKLIGGLGSCGRPYCCSTFLSDFSQVSIKMAKEQNLSLNSSKISGACGKLMCCLKFEHEAYEAEAKITPAVDSVIETPDGMGTVVEANVLTGAVKVKLDSEPDKAPRSYTREEIEKKIHIEKKDDTIFSLDYNYFKSNDDSDTDSKDYSYENSSDGKPAEEETSSDDNNETDEKGNQKDKKNPHHKKNHRNNYYWKKKRFNKNKKQNGNGGGE